MSLEETNGKLDWCKRAFEYENKNSYGIKNLNNITRIKYNEIKNISKYNLLNGIINPTKRTKNWKSHHYPILNGFMNNRTGKSKFKNFCIFLDSGCSSTVIMGTLVRELAPEEDAPMQRHTQAGNITINLKVKVDFALSALSAANIVTWNCHVDDSSKGGYNMILGRYQST